MELRFGRKGLLIIIYSLIQYGEVSTVSFNNELMSEDAE